MIFEKTQLEGLFVVLPTPHADPRGVFARTFCAQEFAAAGLPITFSQCNTSFNEKAGTLRGMHYQVAPFAEGKLVRCTRGAIFDVAIDLRPESPTFCSWYSITLSADNRKALYVPEGFAHGFQTLEDNTEVFYQMTQVYDAASGRGVRWNDPAFGIAWPLREPILNERDARYPDFTNQKTDAPRLP